MSQMAIFLLGPPRIERDGEPVHIGRTKAVALLAYLAVTATPHRRDALATLLWPGFDQSGARAELRRALSVLNRALGTETLVADRETAGLNPDADIWLDTAEFRRTLTACDTHNHDSKHPCGECADRLTQAVAFYRDDFLAGFTLPDAPDFDDWQRFQTEELRDALSSALERLVSWHSEQGDFETAIAYARRWLELDPLHEPAHRQLIQLFVQTGRSSTALRQYRECVRALEQELGVKPSAETTALYDRVRDPDVREALQTVAHGQTEREGAARPSMPHNLPPQPTPFVGRESELADLDGRIADPEVRLITIVGPGGIGKTRLALACAERQLVRPENQQTPIFPHGVYLVSLAPLSEVEHIVPALAEALNFQLQGSEGETRPPRQQILDYVRDKRLLLIMDNFEHLLEGAHSQSCVELLADVMQTAPEVQILTTSRERLNLHQEQVYPIQGLAFPDSQTPQDATAHAAVQLFLQSARRVQPDFELVADDVPHLVRICRSVEGMPLGIELAASWVDVLGLADIASEIEQSFDFLETEWRDVPARHRSMRAVFDVSWGQLSETEHDVFKQLSVFRGGFTRDAARQITGAGLRSVARLVDKSLLEYDRSQDRYQVHELLRQFAASKLNREPAEESALRERHSAYYCSALRRWEADLKSARHGRAVAEIEADYGNIRFAWALAVANADLRHLAIATDGLGEFYLAHGRWSEGVVTFQNAAEKIQALYGPAPAIPDAARLLARLLTWQVVLSWTPVTTYGENQERLFQQSLALLAHPALAEHDTSAEEAFTRQQLGRILKYAASHERVEEGRGHLETSLSLYRTLGDDVGVADALYELHFFARADGAPERARRLLAESLALQRQTGEPRRITRSLVAMGHVSRDLLAFDEAREMFELAYSESQAAGQLLGMEDARRNAVNVAWFLGEFDVALGYLEEALALSRQAASRRLVATNLVLIGLVHAYRGQFSQAAALIQEGAATDQRQDNAWTNSILTFAHLHAGRYEAARALASRAVDVDRTEWAAAWGPRILSWLALAGEKYPEALASSQRSVALCRWIWGAMGREWRAWAQAPLARALLGLGRHTEAKRVLFQALQTCVEIRAFLPLMHLVPVIPLVLAQTEDAVLKERAVELYAMAENLPFVANSRLFQDIAGKHIAAVAARTRPDVVVEAQKRGRALDWWETAETLLSELREMGWASPE